MDKALYPSNQKNYYLSVLKNPIGISLPVNPRWPETYKGVIRKFNSSQQNEPVSLASIMQFIEDARQKTQTGEISLSTLKVKIFALKKAVQETLNSQSRKLELAVILQEIDQIKVPHQKNVKMLEALNLNQLQELVNHVQPHYKPVIMFLINTGARIQSALDLKLVDCAKKTDSKIIYCNTSNPSKGYTISSSLFELILKTYASKTWLFETKSGKPLDRYSVYRALQRAANLLGWVDEDGKSLVNPNLLRYSYLAYYDRQKNSANNDLIEPVRLN